MVLGLVSRAGLGLGLSPPPPPSSPAVGLWCRVGLGWVDGFWLGLGLVQRRVAGLELFWG